MTYDPAAQRATAFPLEIDPEKVPNLFHNLAPVLDYAFPVPMETGETATLSSDRILLSAHTLAAQLQNCPALPTAARFIIEELRTLTHADVGAIFARCGAALALLGGGGSPDRQFSAVLPWCQYVLESGIPIVERHPLPAYRNILVMPLTHAGHTAGVLVLANYAPIESSSLLTTLEMLTASLALRLAHGLQHPDGAGVLGGATMAPDEENTPLACLASHELQSPLTVIKGYAEQMHWAMANGRHFPLQDGITAILRQVDRMRRTIADILDLSTLGAGQMRLDVKEVGLTHVVNRLLDDLVPTLKRPIHRSLTAGVRLAVDPERIEQIVRNLVENAGKYSPPDTPITVSLQRSAGDVEIAVTDRGDGIAPEDIPHLFTPFYRTATARRNHPSCGQGLGLAICRQLAELHRGAIRVESTVGQGSTFTLVLPEQRP